MKYKAVGFDYGGVLTGKPSTVLSSKIDDLLGLAPGVYEQVYYKYNKQVNLGKMSWQDLWKSVLADLNVSHKYDQLMDFFRESDFGHLNVDELKLAADLKRQGIKTGILSNNSKEVAERMRRDGLTDYFDVLDISAETGLVKPDPEAFKHFAKHLDVDITELIFVDDSVNSLSKADTIGYKPILFKDLNSLKDELTQLGVYKSN